VKRKSDAVYLVKDVPIPVMAKKEFTKKDLMDQIQLKVQELNLLASTIKNDRSRNAEKLMEYHLKYLDVLKNG
jgi:hypothetical protein